MGNDRSYSFGCNGADAPVTDYGDVACDGKAGPSSTYDSISGFPCSGFNLDDYFTKGSCLVAPPVAEPEAIPQPPTSEPVVEPVTEAPTATPTAESPVASTPMQSTPTQSTTPAASKTPDKSSAPVTAFFLQISWLL